MTMIDAEKLLEWLERNSRQSVIFGIESETERDVDLYDIQDKIRDLIQEAQSLEPITLTEEQEKEIAEILKNRPAGRLIPVPVEKDFDDEGWCWNMEKAPKKDAVDILVMKRKKYKRIPNCIRCEKNEEGFEWHCLENDQEVYEQALAFRLLPKIPQTPKKG